MAVLKDLIESLKPLTERDSDALDSWVRGTFIQQARDSVQDAEVGSPIWEETVSLAMKEAMKLTWGRAPGSRLCYSSRSGLTRIIWQTVKDKFTRQEIYDLLKLDRDRITMLEEFARINGLVQVSEGEANAKSSP